MQNWEETCSCQSNLSPPESVVQMSLVRPKPQTYMGLELSHSCPDLVLKGSGLKLPSSFEAVKVWEFGLQSGPHHKLFYCKSPSVDSEPLKLYGIVGSEWVGNLRECWTEPRLQARPWTLIVLGGEVRCT